MLIRSVKAYTDAFGPELVRTDKFLALAAAVTTPDDLKKRAGAAAEALKKYQDELKKLDAKLADPLTDVEKKELEVARTGTSDVGETLAVLSASTDDKIKGAYKEFMDARKAETDAGAKVDTACPPGIE